MTSAKHQREMASTQDKLASTEEKSIEGKSFDERSDISIARLTLNV